MTSSGIEPATHQLVGQCLNHLRYNVSLPQWRMVGNQKMDIDLRQETGKYSLTTGNALYNCMLQTVVNL